MPSHLFSRWSWLTLTLAFVVANFLAEPTWGQVATQRSTTGPTAVNKLRAPQATHVSPNQQASSSAKRATQALPSETAPLEAEFDPNAKVISHAGRPSIMKAYELTQTADNDAGYTLIIELGKEGMQKGLDKSSAAYARRLIAWGHNRRGEGRADVGNIQQAFDDFDAAVALDGRQWRALHNRGVCLAMQGKPDAAIADFSRVLEINPKFAHAWFNRGEMLYEKRDFAAAVKDYSASLELAPDDAAALNSRGHALYRLQQFAEAMEDYNQAIEVDPTGGAAYVNRGDLQADQGKFSAAAKDYRTAIRLNPALGRAYQSAAWLMATCPDDKYRNDTLALEAAQKAIELDGSADYRYLETLAAAQANVGEFEAAIQTQEQALENAPPAVVQVYKGRIEKFKAGHPHREPAAQMARGGAIRR